MLLGSPAGQGQLGVVHPLVLQHDGRHELEPPDLLPTQLLPPGNGATQLPTPGRVTNQADAEFGRFSNLPVEDPEPTPCPESTPASSPCPRHPAGQKRIAGTSRLSPTCSLTKQELEVAGTCDSHFYLSCCAFFACESSCMIYGLCYNHKCYRKNNIFGAAHLYDFLEYVSF